MNRPLTVVIRNQEWKIEDISLAYDYSVGISLHADNYNLVNISTGKQFDWDNDLLTDVEEDMIQNIILKNMEYSDE